MFIYKSTAYAISENKVNVLYYNLGQLSVFQLIHEVKQLLQSCSVCIRL